MNKFLTMAGILALPIFISAQTSSALTAKDYQQAENFLAYRTDSLVTRNNLRPNWIAGDKLWYLVTTEGNASDQEFR